MDRIYYLYKIINKVNAKNYIGQTVAPKQRWYDHKRSATNPIVPLQFAIKKYGAQNFEFEIIACCTNQYDANWTETELVKQYESHISTGKGYNATYGGMNAPKSEEWKRKVSEKLMGHEVTQETRDKVSQGNSGKVRSDEFKENVGDFWRGRERSEEHRQGLSESLQGNQNCLGKQNALGYKHTEEAKSKISEASKSQDKRYQGKTWKIIDGKRTWLDKSGNIL